MSETQKALNRFIDLFDQQGYVGFFVNRVERRHIVQPLSSSESKHRECRDLYCTEMATLRNGDHHMANIGRS